MISRGSMAKESLFTSCTISSSSSKCFKNLTPEEEAYLNSRSTLINYRKGELIAKQGSYASHVMYLVSGLVKVFLDNDVNTLVLKIVCPETLFGLTAMSNEQSQFQYSSMAYINSEIRQIELSAFKEVLMQNPSFAKQVIDTLSAGNTQINGRFFCLTYKQSYGRLADILICLSDRIFMTREFHLPLSRRELAELANMSQETLIRMLKKFDDDGLISITDKTFRILDYQRLHKISETG